jgi:hypothetical protein
MGRLGGPRTVIMEDVGVVMDQRGVGNHVRLLLSSSFPSHPFPFLSSRFNYISRTEDDTSTTQRDETQTHANE